MQLLDRVRRTIRRHDLLPRGTRVVVALSAGSDSGALAHLLMELDVKRVKRAPDHRLFRRLFDRAGQSSR